MRTQRSACASVLLLAAGCAVTDGHIRPDARVPGSFSGAAATPDGEVSFAVRSLTELFPDPALGELLAAAVASNHDLALAVARVDEARARLGVADSSRGPQVGAHAAAGASELSRSVVRAGDRTSDFARAGLLASWEIDLWGRLGRLSDAARTDLLAVEWARAAVETSVVADVATAWIELAELDHELAISRRTLASREASLALLQRRRTRGVGDLLDVRREETLVHTAARQIPLLAERIAKTEDTLRFLCGDDPGPVRRGLPLVAMRTPAALPLGRPSDVLGRRPDVRAAEAALAAQEARVDAARALFYPRLSLSGGAGLHTGGGTEFLDASSRFADTALAAVFPVFTSGELTSNLEAERARRRQALVAYDRSIRAAFRDVADAVAERARTEERAAAQRALRDVLTDAVRLARLRFDGGVESYLGVLDAERDLFDAELDLARVERDRLMSAVRLYRALGGGWTVPRGA